MMILVPIALYASLVSQLIHKVVAAVITVNPPTLPITTGCSAAGALNSNANVLQAAINSATAGDVIQLTAGSYYFECNVDVNKPLTIQGACYGLPPNPSGATRNECAGESIIYANSLIAPNGLQGISIRSSNVIIDGLSLQEVAGTGFRSMIAVLDDSGTFKCNGTYSNITLRYNYMKGSKGSSTATWGGATVGNLCTISNLSVENNVLIVTNLAYALWEPIGFRGATPFAGAGNGTITLNNFQMIGNNITCAPSGGGDCNVLNIGNSNLTGSTLISNNIAYGNNLTDGFCPFRTYGQLIPVLSNNQEVNFTECTNQVLAIYPPTGSPTKSMKKKKKKSKAGSPTKTPKTAPASKKMKSMKKKKSKAGSLTKTSKTAPAPKTAPASKKKKV